MELPDSYKSALIALKDQASAVTEMLPGNDRKKTGEAKTLLRDAQRRMAEHGAATRHIVRLVMNAGDETLTIPEMTEDDLVRLLEAECS